MAFYGSIKAFINLGKLLYLPVLSIPCREVKLFMWLSIGYVDCILKETISRTLCFHEDGGENYRGRQEEYGYPEGPHSKGHLG